MGDGDGRGAAARVPEMKGKRQSGDEKRSQPDRATAGDSYSLHITLPVRRPLNAVPGTYTHYRHLRRRVKGILESVRSAIGRRLSEGTIY